MFFPNVPEEFRFQFPVQISTAFKFHHEGRSFLLLSSAAAERQSPSLSLGMPSSTSRRCIPNKRGGGRAARRWTELHNRIELNIRIMDAMRRLDTLAYVPIAAPPIMALTKSPPKRRYNLPMHPARSPSSSDIKLGEKRSSRTQMR